MFLLFFYWFLFPLYGLNQYWCYYDSQSFIIDLFKISTYLQNHLLLLRMSPQFLIYFQTRIAYLINDFMLFLAIMALWDCFLNTILIEQIYNQMQDCLFLPFCLISLIMIYNQNHFMHLRHDPPLKIYKNCI